MNLLNNARVRSFIAGGVGGLIGWIFVEALVAPKLNNPFITPSELYSIDALFGAMTGVCIGGILGLAGGLISFGPTSRAWTTTLISALAGLMGGAIGLVIGEAIYQPLKTIPFLGRGIGWAAFGAVLGAAEGITRRSTKGFRNAALGGLIGGGIGGVAFDLVGQALARGGDSGASRAIALTILGACIGIFIILMEIALADGILKVVSGRQEGREFYLDKPMVTIGRDERCDVPLFNDPAILPRHATVQLQGGGYVLQAEPGAVVMINKQAINRQMLSHENEVMIGGTRLVYRSRKALQAQPMTPTPTYGPPPVQLPQPLPMRYCATCGTPNRASARFCAKCGKSIV